MKHLEAMDAHLPDDELRAAPTLVQMLRRRAELTPNGVAVRSDGGDATYAGIWNASEGLAGALGDAGVTAGSRVVIVSPNSTGFFAAFYGAQRLGAAAVPVFHDADASRILELTTMFEAQAVVTAKGPSQQLLRGLKDRGIPHLPISAKGRLTREHEPSGASPAMLQCTSGTTGETKGVVLTHANIMANMRQMIVRAKFNRDDVFVSWIPVYHDMGLMMTLIPFYLGAQLVLLPISMNTRRWFKAIMAHRGTVTAAPDFAYRYALRSIPNPTEYDLSSIRSAVIAAEPVRQQTVLDLERKFGLENVIKPAYGLAEATSAVTFPDTARLLVDGEGHVCVGTALDDVEIDVRAGGKIYISGPNISPSYYGHDAHGRWLYTGDIGYIDEAGRLFITGREKNLIIRGGRNFSPIEVERYATAIPGVLDAAAVGIDVGAFEGEQTHVVCEVSGRATNETRNEILRGVIRNIHAGLGMTAKVWLVQSRSIPRTYNGKVQYLSLRQMVRDGALRSAIPSTPEPL